MNVKIEKLDNSRVQMDIAVDKSFVKNEYAQAYKIINSKVRLPGFRPGKVPKNILKQRYEWNIKTEALERVVSRAIDKAVQQENIHIVSSPDLQDVNKVFDSLDEDKDLSFQVTVEVFPVVDLGDYKDIEVSIPNLIYNEDDISNKLKDMQIGMSEKHLKEDGVVEQGDLIDIQYNFYVNERNDYENHIGEINLSEPNDWFDSYKESFLGMKIGEEKEIPAKIPEDYKDPINKGKDGTLYIKITKIQSIDMPEIDDELAKDYNYDNLNDMKAKIEEDLKKICEKKKSEMIYEKSIEKIIENSQFTIGEKIIQNHVDRKLNELEQTLERFRSNLDDYFYRTKQSKEEYQKTLADATQKQLKHELVRDAIIEKENMQISDDDLKDEIQNYADYIKKSFDEAKEIVYKSPELNNLKQMKLFKKLMDHIIDITKVKMDKDQHIYEHHHEDHE